MNEPIVSEMEFDKLLREMKEQGKLDEFVARQVYAIRVEQTTQNRRIKAIEARDANALSIGGGVGGIIGAAMAAFVYWLMKRFGV